MPQTIVKQRILVVEDGDSEREALARLLRLEQFEVATARSAEDAESHLGRPVDLVVSDLRMAQRTGIDLLRAWRQRHPHTPFVILTAYGEVGTAVEAMKLGANDFLAKPVDPVRLLHVVRDLLAAHASAAIRRRRGRRNCNPWTGPHHRPLASDPRRLREDSARRAQQ